MRSAILLSRRQQQVIEFLAAGLKNQEIAKELGISTEVVKNYIRNIFAATGVRNRVELALWYEARLHERKLLRQ
jgi:two-component system, NarL family, nitrate/nitrite response regulator NarL